MTRREAPATGGPSRRQFLVQAAAASAALGTFEAPLRPHVAGRDVVKVGVIGCGGRGAGAAVNALDADPGARLVAVCDLFADRARSALDALREQRPDQVVVDADHCFAGFDGFRRVIESSDVVLIANAAKFHPLHMRTAIEAGRHVFVEKPHGIDPRGVREVRAACELAARKGLSVVSGLHSRFDLGYGETVRRILDGQIGDVVAIEENFLRAPYGLYHRQPGMGEVEYQCSNQYHFAWLSGDDVPQSLVHNVDRSLWAMGGRTPLKCHGLGGRSSMTDPVYGDVFDHHSVVYDFDDGVKLYAFCRTTTGCYNEVSSIVRGTKGRANVLRRSITGENSWVYDGPTPNPYEEEHKALFRAIRAGEPINSGHHMADATLATVMGQMSCYTGEEMTWEQATTSEFGYAPEPAACSFDMEPPVAPGPDGSYPVRVPGRTRLEGAGAR